MAGACLVAAALVPAPANAQFEITYPDTPPTEGQTLLEWADPPVLRHTIPKEARADTSSCGATSEFDLDQTALACWPVLRAAQLLMRGEYAAGEPTGDKEENRAQGIDYADQTIAFIGKPQWPLQEYLLIKAYELKLRTLITQENWEASYDTSIQLVSAIERDLFRHDDFRLAFAMRKQGQVFLELDLYDGAKAILEDARKLLGAFDGDKNALPFSHHSEDMIVHAINRGDMDYAKDTATRYLDHILEAPLGMRFGYDSHIDLLLYLAATRGDKPEALQLLELRFAGQRDYDQCDEGMFQFPRVAGHLIEDPAIIDALLAGGCNKEQLAAHEPGPIKGLRGKTLPSLPM